MVILLNTAYLTKFPRKFLYQIKQLNTVFGDYPTTLIKVGIYAVYNLLEVEVEVEVVEVIGVMRR